MKQDFDMKLFSEQSLKCFVFNIHIIGNDNFGDYKDGESVDVPILALSVRSAIREFDKSFKGSIYGNYKLIYIRQIGDGLFTMQIHQNAINKILKEFLRRIGVVSTRVRRNGGKMVLQKLTT